MAKNKNKKLFFLKNSFYASNIFVCNAMEDFKNEIKNEFKIEFKNDKNDKFDIKPFKISLKKSKYEDFLNSFKKDEKRDKYIKNVYFNVDVISCKLLTYTKEYLDNKYFDDIYNKSCCSLWNEDYDLNYDYNYKSLSYIAFIIISYFSFKDIKEEYYDNFDNKIKKFNIENILFTYFEKSKAYIELIRDENFKNNYNNFKKIIKEIKINSKDYNEFLIKKFYNELNTVQPIGGRGSFCESYKFNCQDSLLLKCKEDINKIEDIVFFIKYRIDNYKDIKGYMGYYFNLCNKFEIVEYINGKTLDDYLIYKCCIGVDTYNFNKIESEILIFKYFNYSNNFFKELNYYHGDRHPNNIMYTNDYDFVNIDLHLHYYYLNKILSTPHFIYRFYDLEIFHDNNSPFYPNIKKDKTKIFRKLEIKEIVENFINYSKLLDYYDLDYIVNCNKKNNLYKYLKRNKYSNIKEALSNISKKIINKNNLLNEDRMISVFSIIVKGNKIKLNQNTLKNKNFEFNEKNIYKNLLKSFEAYDFLIKNYKKNFKYIDEKLNRQKVKDPEGFNVLFEKKNRFSDSDFIKNFNIEKNNIISNNKIKKNFVFNKKEQKNPIWDSSDNENEEIEENKEKSYKGNINFNSKNNENEEEDEEIEEKSYKGNIIFNSKNNEDEEEDEEIEEKSYKGNIIFNSKNNEIKENKENKENKEEDDEEDEEEDDDDDDEI